MKKEVVQLVDALIANSYDYLEGNEASVYAMASLMNQIVGYVRDEAGYTGFDGKVVENASHDRDN